MTVIYINNYGEQKGYSWNETFTEIELDELKRVLAEPLREELKNHIDGKARWVSKYEWEKRTEYLKKRLATFEDPNSSVDDVHNAICDGAALPIPEGVDVEDFIKILKKAYNTGYSKGYDDGRG